ncbi:hypothetical protein [Denitrovibrio acetiphilus]|uniref:hypothetical protein n=1 Tax=Denitrovibrio acetiphilus TaxID=118000 RepID=UPI00145F671D|nr:hypothetical protein [Denitrovibrio acetiphilus]
MKKELLNHLNYNHLEINKLPSTHNPHQEKVYSKNLVQSDLQASIETTLLSHFKNGFRVESPIELARLRRFANEECGLTLDLTDDELKNVIKTLGTLFEGKVYIISAETVKKIKSIVEKTFSNGTGLIFYKQFYELNEKWLFDGSIVSCDMLRSALENQFPRYSHRKNYFTNSDASKPELEWTLNEISRVWGDAILLNYNQIAERLPYIPIEKIKFALSQSNVFIWNSVETYAHLNKITISKNERTQIFEYVSKACSDNGYVSISDVPLAEIIVNNDELSITAIHNAIYNSCLINEFDRNGKIIVYKGDTVDALQIIKEYCEGVDKCSLDDLIGFEKELTGEVHRWIPMEAGYSILVRVEKNNFVAEKYVNFDLAAIDNAIDFFIKGDYLPIRAFTTFSLFPDCGYSWNLFLLESYCRRFSKKFRFDALSVNSRNAGVVIRKCNGLTYEEILVDAVVKSDIILEKNAIEEFLCTNGYIGRRSYSQIEELIQKVRSVR